MQTSVLDTDPLSSAVAERDRNILQTVRNAIRRRDVLLAYQPIVRADGSNKIAFYEGLIRVLDDRGRVIPARDFIHSVENFEEGRLLDCLAIELGTDALAKVPDLRLSINLSAKTIGHPRWEHTLERALMRDATIAERLILEITEASAMDVPEMVINFMARMHRYGISFALDDFGAGQTAFRYFKDFYFDIVKIDGMFINGVDQDSDNQVLVQAMSSIARQFDMFVVAERVETAAEARYLSEIGIDCLQGYLFGAPAIRPPWAETRREKLRA